MGNDIWKKAFTWRFGFDSLKLRKLQIVRQKQSNGRCPWDMNCTRLLCYAVTTVYAWQFLVYIHIGVGSALLVSTNRAMRRPQRVRRVTGTGSHAFLYKGV